jgi:transcriptional regulator with XRE-family HTH domain
MDEDKQIQKTLGGILRGRRLRKYFSQRAFAKHIRMDRSYYAKIENGEADISFSTLRRICKGLRMKMCVFVKRVEKQLP